ncbi:MAG TPA: imidazolonepropionase [Candidatus Didemnitutus sp.]|nr:imidazolonepropionase [Candidatus Didemnitutus sp.]
MSLLIRNARILTLANGARPRRGKELADLAIIPNGEVLVSDGKIAAVGPKVEAPTGIETIDANGRVLMPGFVDCHTHACWAGDRLDEWEKKLNGVPYLEILKAGGGIHATVRAVREATQKQLAASLKERLGAMLRDGTTTVEIKSGYGLTTENELKMLRAIRRAAGEWSGTVVSTALLGHAFEGDLDDYARMVVKEMLPEVAKEFPGITVDAFCEEGAWSLDACVKLFEKARKHHPLRVHADQFNAVGMTAEAIRLHARSVDHLEASKKEELKALAQSETFGVILPCTGFHTDGRYARGGFFVDTGGAIALATNCNPGSSPTHSMPFAISLAVRFCGLNTAEAIAACTVNAAALLGLSDRGTIAPGQRADLILLHHKDERQLAHELGGNPVDKVVCGGQLLSAGAS